jgi:hypothetical protein
MFKRLLTVAVTAATVVLGLGAPAAWADAPVRTCRFVAYSTGLDTFSAVAVGTLVHDNDDNLSIRCYIQVNNVPGNGTPTGTGSDVAVTAGVFTFTASPFDSVEICTQFTTIHGSVTECFETSSADEPPQAVFDLLCVATGFIGANGGINILGQLVIDSTGDVFVLGIKLVDCDAFSSPVAIIRFGG